MKASIIQNHIPNSKSLYYIGSLCAMLQLVTILGYSVVLGLLGPKPTTAAEYFAIYQENPLEMVLRGDFLLMILIGLYLSTFPALYVVLKRLSPVYTTLAVIFTLMAVVETFATESTFALLHLGERYLTAANETMQAQFIAAGEAVIAADMWHSTSAYMVGILLQGSGIMISVIMLRSKDFHKITAIAGIVGNGLDLIQHLIHPFTPSISRITQQMMGPFYFAWFPMLAWDFFRLAKKQSKLEKISQ